MTVKELTLDAEFITLGQLLKNEAIIGSGGQAKWYLAEYAVFVNQELEQRRGRKLYRGDSIQIESEQLTLKLI